MESLYERIEKIQHDPERIRNVCVIAHVDHGKTTLCDSLISSNNIISSRLIGKLKFMDTREDEQLRCITMKSSAISLLYEDQDDKTAPPYVVNLIDSPGHIEFSAEVSAGLRLCDGAIVLVDVLEGVSSQTLRVVKQALLEKVSCFLVLTKMDRLFYELMLSPFEAYKHICIVLDNINATINSLLQLELQTMADNDEVSIGAKEAVSSVLMKTSADQVEKTKKEDESYGLDEEKKLQELETKLTFSPEKGNVLFASCVDCWGFSIFDFAQILSKKLGWKKGILEKVLWGEFYFNAKTKKIHMKPPTPDSKPLFVQMVLENLWKVYETGWSGNAEKFQKIAESFQVKLSEKNLEQLSTEPKGIISRVLRAWLPLSSCVMKKIITFLPNPKSAQKERLPAICSALCSQQSLMQNPELRVIKASVESCNNKPEDPIVVFISKMIWVKKEMIDERGLPNVNTEPMVLVAFGRVFSGRLERGQKILAKTPRPRSVNAENKFSTDFTIEYDTSEVQVDGLYVMMGQSLQGVQAMSAGSICGIIGLANVVFRMATLSNLATCPSFSPLYRGSVAILRVAISTEKLSEMPKLVEGLRKLKKCDPAVEVYTEHNSDIIIGTTGEVHLQRCITDLQDDLAKVKVKVSEPLVFFKETVVAEYLGESSKRQGQNVGQQLKEEANENENSSENEDSDGSEDNEEKKNFKEDDQKDKKTGEKSKKKGGPVNTPKKPKKKPGKGKNKEEEPEDEDYEEIDIENAEGEVNDNRFQFKEAVNTYKKAKASKKISTNLGRSREVQIHKVNMLNVKNLANFNVGKTQNLKISLRVRAIGMRPNVLRWLERKYPTMKKLFSDGDHHEAHGKNSETGEPKEETQEKLGTNSTAKKLGKYGVNEYMAFFKEFLETMVEEETPKRVIYLIVKGLIKFGPHSCGPNLLVNLSAPYKSNLIRMTTGLTGNPSEIMKKILKWTQSEAEDISNEKQAVLVPEETKEQEEKGHQSLEPDPAYVKLKESFGPLLIQHKTKMGELFAAMSAGFEIALDAGPLCDEPVVGVAYMIDQVTFLGEKKPNEEEETKEDNSKPTLNPKEESTEPNDSSKKEEYIIQDKAPQEKAHPPKQPEPSKAPLGFTSDPYGPISGQIMSTVKDSCRQAFLGADPRLVQGVFLCSLITDSENYGAVYDVLRRRRAQFLKEDTQEYTNNFVIEAHLPVSESFGFYDEIFEKTSGKVTPNLTFDQWKILDEDPFSVPLTPEEIEEHGATFAAPNYAKSLINKTRERKGMNTDKKLTVAVDKRSTLSRKK